MLRVILAILFLSGCCPQKLLTTSTQDSIKVEIKQRLITVCDTVVVEVPIESKSIETKDSVSYLENNVAESRAEIKDGYLFHSLSSKPISIEKEVEIIVEARDSIIYKAKTITNVVEVERDLTWWQETQIKGFWLLFAICGGFIFIKKIV